MNFHHGELGGLQTHHAFRLAFIARSSRAYSQLVALQKYSVVPGLSL